MEKTGSYAVNGVLGGHWEDAVSHWLGVSMELTHLVSGCFQLCLPGIRATGHFNPKFQSSQHQGGLVACPCEAPTPSHHLPGQLLGLGSSDLPIPPWQLLGSEIALPWNYEQCPKHLISEHACSKTEQIRKNIVLLLSAKHRWPESHSHADLSFYP
jgi:hypothetical protein